MTTSGKRTLHIFLLAAILLGVPALCAAFFGPPGIWEGVKSFPPRTEDWGMRPEALWNYRCPFSWPWFIGYALFTFACLFPLVKRAATNPQTKRISEQTNQRTNESTNKRINEQTNKRINDATNKRCNDATNKRINEQTNKRFPWWGWFGLVELAVAWVLCWAKFDFCREIQPHISYMPVWIGYILIVNALCVLRSGSSPLTAHPLPYLLTFPASALFWWFFEYLNRYVWNWYYLGVSQMGAGEYALYATICFSSVLPAVTATAALLHTFAPFDDARFADLKPVKMRDWRTVALLGGVSALGLTGIVLIPQYTFPLLWLSPLFVFLLIQSLLGEPCILEQAGGRNWSLVLRFACAALVCGLCWETWNYYAVAKWVYAVPLVHRFQIWEMPLIGFAGYLPVGVECAAVTAWIYPDLIEAGPSEGEDAGQ